MEHIDLATFSFLRSPEAAEIAVTSGFGVVIVDMEHTGVDWSLLLNIVVSVQAQGGECWARIPKDDETSILRALEFGCDGIVVPFVESAGDVSVLTDAIRFPPQGHRQTCTLTRAAGYGRHREDFGRFASSENARVKLVGLIESEIGARDIDQICAVDPGLDGIIVGRSDLAGTLGRPGAVYDDEVMRISVDVLHAAERRVPIRGVVIYGEEEAPGWVDRGATLVVFGADTWVLAEAYRRASSRFGSSPRGS